MSDTVKEAAAGHDAAGAGAGEAVRPRGLPTDPAAQCAYAHLGLVALGCLVLAWRMSATTLLGSYGLMMMLTSTLYSLLSPLALVAVVPPALMLAVSAGAPRAIAPAVAGTYATCALCLACLGLPFLSAYAIAAAAACAALAALALRAYRG